MDRYTRTLDVVKAVNLYNNSEIKNYELLEKVCEYFDYVKDQKLDDGDLKFLVYLSNKAGVPQYYDILSKFNVDNSLAIDDEAIGLNTISSLLYESSLFTDESSKLHQYQMDILNLFKFEQENRFFLSASTSFGKTHLVYEVIKKMNYRNVVLIFPSIALLTENLTKLKERKIIFQKEYEIHTLSEIDKIYGENNIFIFTPERFLSFLDKDTFAAQLDFVFIDEIYKIDNGFIIDDEAKENERDVAYRMALFYGLSKYSQIDVMLAGPYIEIFSSSSDFYNPSFDLFLKDFRIAKLLRNEFEIVHVSKTEIESSNDRITIDGIEFDFTGTNKKSKKARIQELLDKILLKKENAIIYCNTKSNVEKVASEYERGLIDISTFTNFINHLENKYDKRWIVIESLKKGVGVHHGVVPKYVQKEIVNLFNQRTFGLDVLVSTTTITEGVNTTAKNMIVYKSEKGSGKFGKPLLTFDAKNIAGRAGRFMEHYTGRVISLDKQFIEKVNEVGDQIKHKNYDLATEKMEIDDEMTPAEFLDDRSKARLEVVKKLQEERKIPENVISQFKVISRRDKIDIYDKIKALSDVHNIRIKRLIRGLNFHTMSLDKDGFQVILDIIKDNVSNDNLKALIENKYRDRFTQLEYSILIASLGSYLSKGFQGVYQFYLKREQTNKNKNAVNSAMRQASNLIYNTFKYQLVKYLGVFNLMYKLVESENAETEFESVAGIDKLLIKLEYNAFSNDARTASDYGVPQKIIDYYDSRTIEEGNAVFRSFDKYENEIYQKIKKLIE